MNTRPDRASSAQPTTHAARIGCVSYLNASPLIEGLDEQDDLHARYDVPARLLEDLEREEVDVALCPVIDYHRAAQPLVMVPVGGIGSEGTTLTVRLYSRSPVGRVDTIHADSDSHTSVALLQVLMHEMHGRRVRIIDYHAREQVVDHRLSEPPEAMLLIGDKVVTDSPLAVTYPHQLDLGQAWHEMTGLPFVFAIWMARQGCRLGDLPSRLAKQRERNAGRIDQIVERRAARHGWPGDLARQYLGEILRYRIGERELEAIERFGTLAERLGLIPQRRPLTLWQG